MTYVSQKAWLEDYLRGTAKTITVNQARKLFGIQSLPARISEMRSAGLRVNVTQSKKGTTRYSILARDVNGSRARKFNVTS